MYGVCLKGNAYDNKIGNNKMPLFLPEILTISLNQIPIINVPHVFYGNGTQQLKRAIYMARAYLSKRAPAEIEQACADIICLYQYFFELKEKELRAKIIQNNKLNGTSHYFDLGQYISDCIDNLKLTYLNERDVLCALLYYYNEATLNQISGVMSGFSNFEFFCALSLYCSSNAFSKIRELQKIMDEHDNVYCCCAHSVIEEIYGAVLEAVLNIEHAKQLNTIDLVEHSLLAQSYLKKHLQMMNKKSQIARYGDKYQQRRNKAVELYKNGKYRSRFDAAFHLIEPIQKCSLELGLPPLKLENAQDTIYKWLSSHDKIKQRP